MIVYEFDVFDSLKGSRWSWAKRPFYVMRQDVKTYLVSGCESAGAESIIRLIRFGCVAKNFHRSEFAVNQFAVKFVTVLQKQSVT